MPWQAYWCSFIYPVSIGETAALSNTLFRPDAGTLQAYLVDAENS